MFCLCMANLEFFTARNDQKTLIEFVFAQTGLSIFESYSCFDCELREFS